MTDFTPRWLSQSSEICSCGEEEGVGAESVWNQLIWTSSLSKHKCRCFFSYSIVRKSKQRPAPVSWQSFSKTFASIRRLRSVNSSHKQSRDDVLLGAQFSDLQSKPPGTVLATLWGRFWFDSSRKSTYELLFINPGNDLIWNQSLDLT